MTPSDNQLPGAIRLFDEISSDARSFGRSTDRRNPRSHSSKSSFPSIFFSTCGSLGMLARWLLGALWRHTPTRATWPSNAAETALDRNGKPSKIAPRSLPTGACTDGQGESETWPRSCLMRAGEEQVAVQLMHFSVSPLLLPSIRTKVYPVQSLRWSTNTAASTVPLVP